MTLTEARTNLEIAIGLYGATTSGKDVSEAIDELVRAAKEEAWDDGFATCERESDLPPNPYRKAGK